MASLYSGNTSVQVNTDVATKELPFPLSNAFMKQANMVADFQKDKVLTLGENVDISYITTEHYTLPLKKPKQVISGLDKSNSKIVLMACHARSNKKIPQKLHWQLTHLKASHYWILLTKVDSVGAPVMLWNQQQWKFSKVAIPVVGNKVFRKCSKSIMKEKSFYTLSVCAPSYHLLQHCATNILSK